MHSWLLCVCTCEDLCYMDSSQILKYPSRHDTGTDAGVRDNNFVKKEPKCSKNRCVYVVSF